MLIRVRLMFGLAMAGACAIAGTGAFAQDKTGVALPSVTVTAQANRDPVEKSYRKMIRGMDLFAQQRSMAPQAVLRFKLLPRWRGADMNRVEMEVLGSTVDFAVSIAPDHTFTLERNQTVSEE